MANRNIGPRNMGMNRSQFLRSAGMGAAALGATTMGMSGMASAANPRPKFFNGPWKAGQTVSRMREYGKLKATYPMYPVAPYHTDSPEGHTGYDCDFVRALAAAVFNTNSPDAYIEWHMLPVYHYPDAPDDHNFDDRFNLLGGGITDDLGRYVPQIDVSALANTHKFQRDAYLPNDKKTQAQWGPIYVHDGAGIAFNKMKCAEMGYPDGFLTKDDIPKGTPSGLVFGCQQNSSNEAIVDGLIAEGYAITKQTYSLVDGYAALVAGLIPVFVDDFSGMTAYLGSNIARGAQLDINPIGWCISEGDSQFHDILNWVTWGLFAATHYGVSSANLSAKLADPALPGAMKVLFGLAPVRDGYHMWEMRGCDKDCFIKVIQAVGNWGEIWDRHMTTVLGGRVGSNSTDGRMFFPILG